MTVYELMQALEHMPPEARVCTNDNEYGALYFEDVELVTATYGPYHQGSGPEIGEQVVLFG